MGATTYTGNGSSSTIKAIAESFGDKMPSFFGYMVYSLAILLPILTLRVWLFLMSRRSLIPQKNARLLGRTT
jgi:hypothetical protein